MLVADWLAEDGRIAERLPGFEMRPQQCEMAEAIASAFSKERHLAVEAGTGIGKTFAYLLPAIEQIIQHKRRVIVSTHTIALQEQLIHKDVPFLQAALGESFKAELVKGRHNYLSLRRLKGASTRQRSVLPNMFLRNALHVVEDWAYETEDGSLSDLPDTPPIEVWEKVRSEHNNCLGRRCPTYVECFYQRARRRAEAADLLVVNHALLIADLVLRRENASVLPDYDLVIVDEAHTLEQVATSQFGVSVSNSHVQYALANLFNERTGKGYLALFGEDQQRQKVIAAQAAGTQFFNDLTNWQRTRGRSNGRLVIDSERCAAVAGDLRGGVFRIGDVRIETATLSGAAVIVSLDGPLATSRAFTARLVSNAVNSAMAVEPPGPRSNPRGYYELTDAGRGPVRTGGRLVSQGWRIYRGGTLWFAVGLADGAAEITCDNGLWRCFVDTPETPLWMAGARRATVVIRDGRRRPLSGGGPWRFPADAALLEAGSQTRVAAP